MEHNQEKKERKFFSFSFYEKGALIKKRGAFSFSFHPFSSRLSCQEEDRKEKKCPFFKKKARLSCRQYKNFGTSHPPPLSLKKKKYVEGKGEGACSCLPQKKKKTVKQ